MEFVHDNYYTWLVACLDACKKEKREDNHRNMGYLSRLWKTLES